MFLLYTIPILESNPMLHNTTTGSATQYMPSHTLNSLIETTFKYSKFQLLFLKYSTNNNNKVTKTTLEDIRFLRP